MAETERFVPPNEIKNLEQGGTRVESGEDRLKKILDHINNRSKEIEKEYSAIRHWSVLTSNSSYIFRTVAERPISSTEKLEVSLNPKTDSANPAEHNADFIRANLQELEKHTTKIEEEDKGEEAQATNGQLESEQNDIENLRKQLYSADAKQPDAEDIENIELAQAINTHLATAEPEPEVIQPKNPKPKTFWQRLKSFFK